jgi:hypothetical protein
MQVRSGLLPPAPRSTASRCRQLAQQRFRPGDRHRRRRQVDGHLPQPRRTRRHLRWPQPGLQSTFVDPWLIHGAPQPAPYDQTEHKWQPSRDLIVMYSNSNASLLPDTHPVDEHLCGINAGLGISTARPGHGQVQHRKHLGLVPEHRVLDRLPGLLPLSTSTDRGPSPPGHRTRHGTGIRAFRPWSAVELDLPVRQGGPAQRRPSERGSPLPAGRAPSSTSRCDDSCQARR